MIAGLTVNDKLITKDARRPQGHRPPPSVLASWMKVLLIALQHRGIDTTQMIADSHIDTVELDSPHGRYPLIQTIHLWQYAADQVDDPGLGIWVSKYAGHTTFHGLGYAFMASSTLLEAIQRVTRYSSMVSDVAEVSLITEDDVYRLRWQSHWNGPQPTHEAMEAIIATIIRSCRKIHLHEFKPCHAKLMRPRPDPSEIFDDFFQCPIEYNSDCYELTFYKRDLEKKLRWGNEDLARSNDKVITDYLQQLETGSISTRLRLLLINSLPSGLKSHEQYARMMAMSGRSLQRRLAEEGTSYNEVLQDTRLSLAKSYLEEGDKSLTEIAFLLGFADTSSFSRAFKKWTNVCPSAWSKNNAAHPH